MKIACRRCVVLALLFVGLASWAAFGLPGFSDRNTAAGNLNPTDTILVQEIRVTRSAGEDIVLSAITIRNTGTADGGEIEKITIRSGGNDLGGTEDLAGIRGTNGVTIPLGFEMTATTHTIEVFVTIGTSVGGGETVQFRCLFDYTRNNVPGTSSWITDLTGETIRDGGFDETDDSSPDPGYLNPLDQDEVQVATFTDNDANGSPVWWDLDGVQTETSVIVTVENLGSAETTDIDRIRVTITMAGAQYTTGWVNWVPGSPMDFEYQDFIEDANEDGDQDGGGDALPTRTEDNATTTIKTEVEIEDAANVTDNRTIQMETTVRVKEEGEGVDGDFVSYEQTVRSESTHTIREQGFEQVDEESESLASGTAATNDVILQTVRLTDDDSNDNDVRLTRFYVRNAGTADGDEIKRIRVVAGADELLDIDNSAGGNLDDFRTGDWYDLDDQTYDVEDDEDEVVKIYYTIGTPDDGHTFRPVVRFTGQEPPVGTAYNCDEATYPDSLGLYEPGFEFIENVTPPTGGTAYSSQKLLAQRIRVEDRDEDDDDVAIDPILVRNAGTATGNPDITKIEIWRQDTIGGEETKIGEEDDLVDIRTSGVRIDITNDNIVQDDPDGSIAYLLVYLQLAEPEDVHEGNTIQLTTRVIHTEKNGTYDKDVDSNQWILEINHRPVPNFTFEEAAAQATAITPKQDFQHDQVIQFNGTATDPDGDDIVAWHWDFGDGNTSNEQNPTHQYPNGGTFDVTLTVTDERGVTGEVTKTLEIEGPPNQPPEITELNADPQNPAVDQDVDFEVVVEDPDQPEGTAFDYAWDFGDETTSTTAAPTHSFDEAGEYTVEVTVTDSQGATDTATIEISVGNEAPTLTGVEADPATGNTGDPITFAALGYDDPDDDAADEYRWDFGDDSTATTDGATVTHTYGAPDDYTVTVRVVDARGAISAPETVDITVEGPVRVVAYAFPNPATAAATITYFLPEGAVDPVLRIFDVAGRLIFEQALGAGGTYEWNLRNERGGAVGNGLYFIVVTATSENGRGIRSDVFRLLIAR